MEIKDKLEIKWMIAEMITSPIHTKETALREIINWINNFDRGR